MEDSYLENTQTQNVLFVSKKQKQNTFVGLIYKGFVVFVIVVANCSILVNIAAMS